METPQQSTPGKKGGGDISNHAPVVQLPPPAHAGGGPTPNDAQGLIVDRIRQVEPEDTSWLWHGRIPQGKLVIIDGDPGVSKSLVSIDFAARISSGTPWPDGQPCPTGNVGFIAPEDNVADTIKPRLIAAGADQDRVYSCPGVGSYTEEGEYYVTPLSLPNDLGRIREFIAAQQLTMLVLDPIMALLHGVDSNKDQDVRRVLTKLTAIGDSLNCTILIIRHLNKAAGGSAIYRGGGSIGIIGAARVGYVIAKDRDDEERRIMACQKFNVGKTPPAMAYRIASHDNGMGYIDWEPEPVNITADQLLAPVTPTPPKASTLGDHKQAIVDYINQQGTCTTKQVAEALNLNPKQTGIDLSKLANGNHIERVSRGNYGPISPTSTTPTGHPEQLVEPVELVEIPLETTASTTSTTSTGLNSRW